MSSIKNSNVSFAGDGNVVGSHNSVTVQKRVVNNHHSKSEEKENRQLVFALLILVGFAAAFMSYYFAKYSDYIYISARFVSLIEVLLAVLGAYLHLEDEDYMSVYKYLLAATVTAVISVVLMEGHENYPAQLLDMANQSGSLKDFWCGLNVYGRQVALLHALTIGIGLAISTLVLMPATIVQPILKLFVGYVEVEEGGFFDHASSWFLIGTTGVIAAIVFYFHTAPGFETWTSIVKNPSTLIFCNNA
jgi:hypothetical protein